MRSREILWAVVLLLMPLATACGESDGSADETASAMMSNTLVGGMTLVPGVYKRGTGLLIPTDVALSCSATELARTAVTIDGNVVTEPTP